MAGRVYAEGHRVTDGIIDTLRLENGVVLQKLRLPAGDVQPKEGVWRINLPVFQQRSPLHARLPSGKGGWMEGENSRKAR